MFGPLIVSLCLKGRVATTRHSSLSTNDVIDDVTFAEFLYYVATAASEQLDIHWTPYNEICDFCNPHWQFDFIGKFETIEEESNYLLDKFGAKAFRVPHGYRSKDAQRIRSDSIKLMLVFLLMSFKVCVSNSRVILTYSAMAVIHMIWLFNSLVNFVLIIDDCCSVCCGCNLLALTKLTVALTLSHQ